MHLSFSLIFLKKNFIFVNIADLVATKLVIDCQLTDLDDELARYKDGSAEYRRVFGVMQVICEKKKIDKKNLWFFLKKKNIICMYIV